jgi:hypothetical protein
MIYHCIAITSNHGNRYYHVPFTHCPTSEEDRTKGKCTCEPKKNFDWKGKSSVSGYYFSFPPLTHRRILLYLPLLRHDGNAEARRLRKADGLVVYPS